MNETIQLLKNHRSVREFQTETVITEAQSKAIIEASLAAPNWINGQQVSVIEVRDKKRKADLAKAAGNQPWIEEAPIFYVFCMDFQRAYMAATKNSKVFNVVENIEAVMIGSTDVGIALANAAAAAESLGLGIVPIGGIRKNPESVINILDLPKYVFPISGLVVGQPRTIPDQKPRLPLEAVYHKEKYNFDVQSSSIERYDETVTHYMQERTNGNDSSNWTSKIAAFYDQGFEAYATSVPPALKKQGFTYR